MSTDENLGPQFVRHEYVAKDIGRAKPKIVHEVVARKGDTEVGRLSWLGRQWPEQTQGEVSVVEVHADHRRQGIASGMWTAARAYADLNEDIPEPKHSNDRSAAGDAWAKSVTPRDKVPRSW